MLTAELEVGYVLDGKFRVERILGMGGMGVVVAATHLTLDKLVALKFMLDGPDLVEFDARRFLREAKAAARLTNKHIAKVLDVGTLEGGSPYMVMEYLDGIDLEHLIESRKKEKQGPLPAAVALSYMWQASEGISEAHALGIIHRDLKPANLFLTEGLDGQALIKILDFGIAKADFDGIQTQTKAFMGTPAYMPPEQWKGARDVDPRSDIWAIGAILHYLVTGRAPFRGKDASEMHEMVMNGQPQGLADPTLGLPEEVQNIIRWCLEKDPLRRPQNGFELSTHLAGVLGGEAPRPPRSATSGDNALAASGGRVATAAPDHSADATLQTGVASATGVARAPSDGGAGRALEAPLNPALAHDPSRAFATGASPRHSGSPDHRQSSSSELTVASGRARAHSNGEGAFPPRAQRNPTAAPDASSGRLATVPKTKSGISRALIGLALLAVVAVAGVVIFQTVKESAVQASADRAPAERALADQPPADPALADQAPDDQALADQARADQALAARALADPAREPTGAPFLLTAPGKDAGTASAGSTTAGVSEPDAAPAPSRITLVTEPGNAEVRINGELVGRSPIDS